jgi:hypothetical protein
MLSDDGIENQFKYLEGLISTCRVRGYDIGESVSLADESLRTLRKWIASGELMVVITTKIEEVHTSDGIFFECVACGVDYPSSDALKPGEFCRCGAKIIEG